MLIYVFDRTLDGVLSAVFDAYSLRQRPDALIGEGEPFPLFCDESHRVATTEEKARRVWKGLEKHLSHESMRMLAVSYLSEDRELDTPLFHYIYKVFEAKRSLERNFADPDVLFVTNTARRVMHERLRMMQFIRFQKAQDGTYLGVVHPDHNVLPLIIDHFRDRFQDQPWLIYDARHLRGYGVSALRPAHGTTRRGTALGERPTLPKALAHLLQGHLHQGTHEPQEATQRHAPPLLGLHDRETIAGYCLLCLAL